MKYINDDKTPHAALSLSTWYKRRKLSQEMQSLNDRMLSDIGISRGDIASVVEQSYPRVSLMAVLAGWFDKWAQNRKNRIIAYELASFDAHILADIGLSRSDIKSISDGHYPLRHAHTFSTMGSSFNASVTSDAHNDDVRRAA